MKINFQPLGKRVEISDKNTILDAAHQSGIDLAAICGAGGTCGSCKVRLAEGILSPLTETEKLEFSDLDLQVGFRLACQCHPVTDCAIEIPPESLTTPQRTQIEGMDAGVELDLSVRNIPVNIAPPEITDTRADDVRILNALEDAGIGPSVHIGHTVLRDLSEKLRIEKWSGSVIISQDSPAETIAFLGSKSRILGLAGDLGSTKLALYLVDLENGETIAKIGAMNPQISYGEDVVSRIGFANRHAEGRTILQRRLVETINQLTLDMCTQTGTKPDWIVDIVMVGNTAMHHFFAGLPVEQLALAPYIAAVGHSIQFSGREIGLNCAPGARVYMPPNVAGFVGADHLSMLLAAGSWRGEQTILSMDIGTNTEISLLAHNSLYSCSCASGPAFEGAHIHSGMRAAPGAIERVQIRDGKIYWQTIEGKPPVGTCGSGILEAVSEMKTAQVIDERGVFNKASPLVDFSSGKGKFVLVPARQTANSTEITVSRYDINQIQLAKAAIWAGVEVLIDEAKIHADDIDQFIIAGAFGTYLDIEHSINIGMFPDLPLERFSQIGNAAGVGARQLLLSRKKREEASEIARQMNYVELTNHPDFTEIYMNALYIRKG